MVARAGTPEAAARGLRISSAAIPSVIQDGQVEVAGDLAKIARGVLAQAPGRYKKSWLEFSASKEGLVFSGPTAIGAEIGRETHDVFGTKMKLWTDALKTLWPPRVKGQGYVVGRAWDLYQDKATQEMALKVLGAMDKALDRQGVY